MDILEFLDKAIAATDKAVEIRTRVVQTVGEGVKILTAINGADLGETEKAIASRLLTLSERLMIVLDGPITVPPTPTV